MKVLMISTDRNIFNKDSEVRQRMLEYGGLVEELYIIVFAEKKLGFKPLNLGNVFVQPTNSRNRWLYILDAIKIGKKTTKPDLITSQDPFETGVVGWRIAKHFSSKLQFQIHTDFLNKYFISESFLNKIRVKIAKFLIPKADCIRVVSKRIAQSLGGAFAKPVVLPVFVDVEKIKNQSIEINLKEKYPQFDFIILMASRLTKEKNIGMAIGAMANVVKQYPKVGLVIVGNGPERNHLLSQISNLKVEKNVMIESWASDLPSYYKTTDIFLLTSNYEGYGRTVIEAATCGCPVIMTDVGIANDVLKGGLGGKVIPVGNIRMLEDLLKSLCVDNETLNNLSLYSSKIIEKIPTKVEYLGQYKKHWESCVG
ncbi:MAG: glycosyltransferase [Candidatus Marinimicrobia bacterium]|nr:glycosyltransferase [Candidatus Neomarinimicrobiota bacterium]